LIFVVGAVNDRPFELQFVLRASIARPYKSQAQTTKCL